MTPLTVEDFIRRWAAADLREQQAAQSHFNELCHLLGVPTPTEADPKGEFFTFEQHVTKDSGGAGRADVWYKGRFAWEYKGKRKDLDAAYSQLQSYSASLNFPPLLVVCDLLEYRIYPQWPNIDRRPWVVLNEGLKTEYGRDLLRRVLTDPDSFYRERQGEINRRERITAELARQFSRLAQILQDERYGTTERYTPMQVARFLTKLLFAMFAEDIDLLPVFNGQKVLEYIFEHARRDPTVFQDAIRELFGAMAGKQPRMFLQRVPYFNGGLFDERADDLVLDLGSNEDARNVLFEVNLRDWKDVEPSIFGTLFERALDPAKRSQLGAHYTSESDIRLVIEPVLMAPLRRRWAGVLTEAAPLWTGFNSDAPRQRADAKARLAALYHAMLDELAAVTVLDPACGSGNFLYVSLLALKDFEEDIHEHFKPLGLPVVRRVSPRQLLGIELNGFAAELAHVVVWIGDLQWQHRREGYGLRMRYLNDTTTPVIDERLEPGQPPRILNADAVLRYSADGQPYEPEWPPATVIIGNPPFLGSQSLRAELGDKYTEDLRKIYAGRLPGGTDLVTYWFEKARAYVESEKTKRVGLISTNSIRGGANREVLERIKKTGDIFMAWSDNPWVLSGAAVRISIVGFTKTVDEQRYLDGKPVEIINPDLTILSDLTVAKALGENRGLAFIGPQKDGPLDIPSTLALEMLTASNQNRKVLRPYLNGSDIVGISRNVWIVDFWGMSQSEASQFMEPFQYVLQNVKPIRDTNRDPQRRDNWWRLGRSGDDYRKAVNGLKRQIFSPRVSKHRIFVWVSSETFPDSAVVAIARDDDYFFGVLHSYLHELWSLRLGTWLGKGNDPRYTPTTTFETFPFPVQPHPPVGQFTPPSPLVGEGGRGGEGTAAIAAAAAALHAERHAWLNPAGVAPSDPLLKRLTLTNLYNALADHRAGKPLSREAFPFDGVRFVARLAQLHDALDAAVLGAYGWDDLAGQLRTPAGDEEALRRLLAENLRRSGGG